MWPRRRFCSCPIGRVQFHRSARRIEGQARYPGRTRFERRPSLAPRRPSRLQRPHRSRPATRLEQGSLAGFSRRALATSIQHDRPSRPTFSTNLLDAMALSLTIRLGTKRIQRRGPKPPSETNHGRTSARANTPPGLACASAGLQSAGVHYAQPPLPHSSFWKFSTQLP
jgi:hypothetical protein